MQGDSNRLKYKRQPPSFVLSLLCCLPLFGPFAVRCRWPGTSQTTGSAASRPRCRRCRSPPERSISMRTLPAVTWRRVCTPAEASATVRHRQGCCSGSPHSFPFPAAAYDRSSYRGGFSRQTAAVLEARAQGAVLF